MASTSSIIELNNFHDKRSLSLPSKINSIHQKIEQQLNNLRIKEESSNSPSETIIIGVSGLAELYGCINRALSLPMTQQSLSLRQHEKHVAELLKGCCNLLNVCTQLKTVVQKQGVITKEMKSSLTSTTTQVVRNVGVYNSVRKEVIRNAKQVFTSLNQIVAQVVGNEDYHVSSTVIKSLKCVGIINLSVIESVLCLLSTPLSKPKRSMVSMLMMNKGRRKVESGNEMIDVDVVLHELVMGKKGVNEDEKLCLSIDKLEELLGVIVGIENGLSNVCKELSQTKLYIMNILSF